MFCLNLFVCLGFGAAGIPAEWSLKKGAFFSGNKAPPKAGLLGQSIWMMVWNHRGHLRESEDVPPTSPGGHTGDCLGPMGWGPGWDDGGCGPGSSGGLSSGSWCWNLAARPRRACVWLLVGILGHFSGTREVKLGDGCFRLPDRRDLVCCIPCRTLLLEAEHASWKTHKCPFMPGMVEALFLKGNQLIL